VTASDWGLLLGAMFSVAATLLPWLVMINSKLAVLGAKIASLCNTLEKIFEQAEVRVSIEGRQRENAQDGLLKEIEARLRALEEK